MRLRKNFLAAFAASCLATFGTATPIDIMEVKAPPRIDGVLSDACWKDATRIDTTRKLGGNEENKETEALLCRDNAWLYLAFKCHNQNARLFEQKVFERDDAVFMDDAVEIFIFPDPQDPIFGYQFTLNFANVSGERRHPGPEIAWTAPWRSATTINADGWTAEIAIPFSAIDDRGFAKTKLNWVRDLCRITQDPYGAKLTEQMEKLSAAPVKTVYDRNAFFDAKGLPAKIDIPFAPEIVSAEIKDLRETPEGFLYTVRVDIAPATATTGEVEIRVIDQEKGVAPREFPRTLKLSEKTTVTINVPIRGFGERSVRVEARKPDTGEILSSAPIAGLERLEFIDTVAADRNYYTDEPVVKIKVLSKMASAPLQQATISVFSGTDRMLENISPTNETIIPIPLSTFKIGTAALRVAVEKSGREVASKSLTIVRRAPNADHEVKIDHFRKSVLKNGKPFFPFGVYNTACDYVNDGDADAFYALVKNTGFNTVIRGYNLMDAVPENVEKWLKAAEKNQLAFLNWGYVHPSHVEKAAKKKQLDKKDYLALAAPKIARLVDILKNSPNYLGFYNVDEPNLRDRDDRAALAEWIYADVIAQDPYHPVLSLYARNIPSGKKWTAACEILGYDVYSHPDWGNAGNDPGASMTYYTLDLKKRADQDGKIFVMVPSGGMLDPGRDPVPLTEQEQLCQAYAAIIHGARGLLYFSWSAISAPENWKAMKTLSAQVDKLSAAVLNDETRQIVVYSSGPMDYRRGSFPTVAVRLFQYPSGDYVLLAANLKRVGADARFTIKGLKSATKMFAENDKLPVVNASFQEKIEPNGVRAYRLNFESDSDSGSKEIGVAATELPTDESPSFPLRKIVSATVKSKNHMPNPRFDQFKVVGVPAFIKPDHIVPCYEKEIPSCRADGENPWNGKPSLRLLKENFPMGTGKLQRVRGVCYPPASAKAERYTFSFYAKADRDGAETLLWFPLGSRHKKTFALTKEWKRYVMSNISITPETTRSVSGGIVYIFAPVSNDIPIWLSGLQLEKGDTATEFEDNRLADLIK